MSSSQSSLDEPLPVNLEKLKASREKAIFLQSKVLLRNWIAKELMIADGLAIDLDAALNVDRQPIISRALRELADEFEGRASGGGVRTVDPSDAQCEDAGA